MNREKAGGKAFENVDEALAGRIISRSKENSKDTAPAADVEPAAPDAGRADDFPRLPEGSLPLVKMAALLLALLAVMFLLFRRREKG